MTRPPNEARRLFGDTITATLDGAPALVTVHGRYDAATLVVGGPDGRVRLVPAPDAPAETPPAPAETAPTEAPVEPPSAPALAAAEIRPGDVVIVTDCWGDVRQAIVVTGRGAHHVIGCTAVGARPIFFPESLLVSRASAEDAAPFRRQLAAADAAARARIAERRPAPSPPPAPRGPAMQLALF